jgi:hypothetical protein
VLCYVALLKFKDVPGLVGACRFKSKGAC